MRTGPHGLALIKHFEGLRLAAYRDVAGVWTVGYGHTAGFRDGRFGGESLITTDEADGLLQEDLERHEARVEALVEVPISQYEYDALVSFDFNTGGLGRSTVLRRLNEGDRLGAADAFLLWNKARIGGALRTVRGLTRRRIAERTLFLTPYASRTRAVQC